MNQSTSIYLPLCLPFQNLSNTLHLFILFFQFHLYRFQIRDEKQWFWHSQKSYPPLGIEEFVTNRLLNSTFRTDNHECRRAKDRVCVARSRFHLSLARLGKTPLDKLERDLLESELYQAKRRRNDTSRVLRKYPVKVKEKGVPNRVFLFESSQGKEEYFYKELAQFVNIDRSLLPPIDFNIGNGLNKKRLQKLQSKEELFDICLPKFDYVRKEIMPISYVLGTWILRYLLPASSKRNDLVIPNPKSFVTIIESFLKDPCDNRLVRNEVDGEYYLVERRKAN